MVPNFQTRIDGAPYALSSSTIITWGGSETNSNSPCECYIRYMRVYLDWLADSSDAMINLALLSAESKNVFFLSLWQVLILSIITKIRPNLQILLRF